MDINSFIICPKCGSMEAGERRTRCGVCNFAHEVVVTASVDPIDKSADISATVPIGTPPAEALAAVTPPDPTNG